MIEDDCSINSASSEEEFLWTNNSIRRRRASSLSRSPTNGEKSSSWKSKLASSKAAKALQRSFGSFGTYSSVIQDEDELDEDWQNVNVGPRMTRQSSAPLPGTTIPRRPSYEPQDRNRVARRRYNAQIMPNKVVLMRHGQSMGNIDEGLYSVMPDNSMPLTKLGWEQARKAGQVLKDKVLPKGETVHFIVSPYVRTVETFHGVVSAWCDPVEFKHIKGTTMLTSIHAITMLKMIFSNAFPSSPFHRPRQTAKGVVWQAIGAGSDMARRSKVRRYIGTRSFIH